MTDIQAADADAPDGTRRCLVTREPEPREGLVRFVVADGKVIPDVAERLPGRGAWVGACRARIDEAVSRRLFPRSFGRQCEASGDLADQALRLVERRLLEAVGIARRAGAAIFGRDRCLAAMGSGKAGVLVVAEDAGTESKRMRSAATEFRVPAGTGPGREALGGLFGVARASFVAVAPGALAERVLRETGRLAGLRSAAPGASA